MLADLQQTAFGLENVGGRDEVARAAAGDVQAFESLYRAHLPRVHALALRMAGRDVADELTQDVFVRAWQKLGSFRGESAFGTWLHRLAVNLIVEYFRRQNLARSRASDDLAALDLAPAITVAPTARMGLDAALETLPAGALDGCSCSSTWRATAIRKSPPCSARRSAHQRRNCTALGCS